MLEFVEGKIYRYPEIFGAVIRELNLKFPFKRAHRIIRNFLRFGKLEKVITPEGWIRYKVPEIKVPSWSEVLHTFTFVATKKQEVKGKSIKRMIEIQTKAILPTVDTELGASLLEYVTEAVTRANDYGFVYEEPNLGLGSSFRIRVVQKKKPKRFMASYSCFDHTYNRDKAKSNFELPDNWWLLNSDELAQIFIDNVIFTLLARGRQTKLK